MKSYFIEIEYTSGAKEVLNVTEYQLRRTRKLFNDIYVNNNAELPALLKFNHKFYNVNLIRSIEFENIGS